MSPVKSGLSDRHHVYLIHNRLIIGTASQNLQANRIESRIHANYVIECRMHNTDSAIHWPLLQFTCLKFKAISIQINFQWQTAFIEIDCKRGNICVQWEQRKMRKKMLSAVSVLTLLLALLDISRSSEVNLSAQKSDSVLINSAILNKKLLPNVKHLMTGGNDANRQKFLRLIDGLNVEGYKFVDGECKQR